jgi:hypothetical protein
MCIGLYIKYPLFVSDVMKLELCRHILEKCSDIKCHQNPCNGSRLLCGRTDIRKLVVAFRSFTNAPKMVNYE